MAEYSPTKIKNLFLRQSYIDAWNDYKKALESGGNWDYVVLTASNEAQAKAYQLEIDYRKSEGRLPKDCTYIVLPDPEGKRVGSGGATFHVLKHLAEQIGGKAQESLKGKRVLVIHSGGDSKRVPQYSICGKLFSPVPRQLPDGIFSIHLPRELPWRSSLNRHQKVVSVRSLPPAVKKYGVPFQSSL